MFSVAATLILLIAPIASQPEDARTHLLTPTSVVNEYCRRQMNGVQLGGQGTLWQRLSPLIAWTGEEPPDDTIVVVSGYRTVSATEDIDTATVKIEFKVLGHLETAEKFVSGSTSKIVDFRLVRKQNTWQIAEPILSPHVSPSTLVRRLKELVRENQESGSTEKVPAIRETIRQLEAIEKSLNAGR